MPPFQKQLAVLIVHGAYTDVVSWQNFVWLLGQTGHTVKCPKLPSSSREPTNGRYGLKDDVEVVRAAIKDLIGKGQAILILAHSYGGAVAIEAVTKDLHYSTESDSGVKHLMFVTGFLPLPGESTKSIWERQKTTTRFDFVDEEQMARPTNAAAAIYNDLPPDKAKNEAKDVIYQSLISLASPVSESPWRDIPCTYVFCDRDQSLPSSLQSAMVEELRAAGAQIDNKSINSGHAPFVSKPNELFAIVKSVADTG